MFERIGKKIELNAPLTISFAIISLIFLGLGRLTNGETTYWFCSTYRTGRISFLGIVRMFTYVLGHSNGSHYLNNMVLFILLGPMMEEKYGSMRLLVMMLITAFVGAVAHSIFVPNSVLLGASGIVFMLILLASFANVREGRIPVTFILVMIYYVGNEIEAGLFANDNVSQLTHILGGLCGAIFGYFLNRNKKKETTEEKKEEFL